MYIFAQEKMILGGAETLIIRLAEIICTRGYEVAVYAKEISEEIRIKAENAGATVIADMGWSRLLAQRSFDENDKILTVQFKSFLEVQYEMKKNNNYCDVLFYDVHVYDLFMDLKSKVIYRQLLYRPYKKMISEFYSNGNIFFMEENCTRYAEDYYDISLGGSRDVWLLPMCIEPYGEEDLPAKAESRRGSFEVLSVARADFPFKGYIKGLIEDAREAKKRHPNLKLTIVTRGDGFDQVLEWAAGDDFITIINGMDPKDLKSLYESSHLFFGMGTTVLDAAMNGTPVVPVNHFTYKCEAARFFYEDPRYIAIRCDDDCLYDAGHFIDQVAMMSDREYIETCHKVRDAVVQNYDIELFVDRLLGHKVDKKENYLCRRYEVKHWLHSASVSMKKWIGRE